MRTWTLLLALLMAMLPAPAARSQDRMAALSELLRIDRSLVSLCQAPKDRLDDRERDLWTRRTELLRTLNVRERFAYRRTTPLPDDCVKTIAALAQAEAGGGGAGPASGRRPGGGYQWRRREAPTFDSTIGRAGRDSTDDGVGRPGGPTASPDSGRRPAANGSPHIAPRDKPTTAIKNLFPWPPPTPSTRRSFSPDVMAGRPRAKTAGEVSERLEEALESGRFGDIGYYRAPGGFALVTRIESLDGETGMPLEGRARWGARPTELAGLSLGSIFAITRPKGTYRIFVFVLTDDPPMTQPMSAEEVHATALRWAIEGAPSLPPEIKALRVGPNHVLIVMVYEFAKVEGGETEHFVPSQWPLDQHLSSLGIELKPD